MIPIRDTCSGVTAMIPFSCIRVFNSWLVSFITSFIAPYIALLTSSVSKNALTSPSCKVSAFISSATLSLTSLGARSINFFWSLRFWIFLSKFLIFFFSKIPALDDNISSSIYPLRASNPDSTVVYLEISIGNFILNSEDWSAARVIGIIPFITWLT